MDRNMRYPRRGMAQGSCERGGELNAYVGGSNDSEQCNCRRDYCLCDDQPISLAMAYVKSQKFENLFDPCTALKNGTLFASLCKPYCTGGKQ